MDRLVEATLKHGLVPPVVMEFPGITAGGGYAGTGGESSSFRHGYFNENVKRVEIVLANGDIVNATPEENAELFFGASGAVGSLGITTLLELHLIQAKEFVRVTYQPVSSTSEAVRVIQEKAGDNSLDYLDGILYAPDYGVIVCGQMTDEYPIGGQVQTFSSPSDPWYYLYVKQKMSENHHELTELVPLAEYLFRYDRGGFWVGESAFEYFRFPFNQFTRWFLDDFLNTRMLFEALHSSGQAQNYVVQDLAVPISNAVPFIEYCTSFNIWPLWLCPLRPPKSPTFHPHTLKTAIEGQSSELLLNVGLWGFGPQDYDNYVAKNRELERKVADFGGMKWLYAQTYYSEDEFWSIYDRDWYNSLRKKYKASSLPDVWNKVSADPEAHKRALKDSWWRWSLHFWPIGGIWGIASAIRSQKYMLARNAGWKYGPKPRRHDP